MSDFPLVMTMDRATAEMFVPTARAIAVALHDHDAPQSRLSSQFIDVIHVSCSDWKGSPPHPSPPMTASQAHHVLEFVDRHRASVDQIVVHCLYGQSRAPSLALALHVIYGRPARRPPAPNQLLFDTMLTAARGRAPASATVHG